MMTGLPGDTDEGAYRTARALADLQPDTVRIYPTVVMRDTALECWYREGRYTPPTLEAAAALCARLLSFFEAERRIPVIRLGLHAGTEMQPGMRGRTLAPRLSASFARGAFTVWRRSRCWKGCPRENR